MIKVPFGGVLLSLISLVAVGGLVVSNSNPESDPPSATKGACKESGTTLVIDFGLASNAKTITKCISRFRGTGWQLFSAAGLEVVGTNEYPESFVCRIKDFPNNEVEDCSGTPGALGGSWVYFYSTNNSNLEDSAWARSPLGAATRKPKCGDFEGWLFLTQESEKHVPAIAAEPFSCK